jgi:hypothetical protein
MEGAMDEVAAGFSSMAAGAIAVAAVAAAAAGATAAGTNFISVAFISFVAGAVSVPGIGGASGVTAIRPFAVGAEDAVAEDVFGEATFALEVDAAESDADAGVDAAEGTPRRSVAKADDPNNAKNIAAMATLISLPRRERKRAQAN